MRRFACANGNQKFSTSPWSVDGGMSLLGNWASSTLFCGPGDVAAAGIILDRGGTLRRVIGIADLGRPCRTRRQDPARGDCREGDAIQSLELFHRGKRGKNFEPARIKPLRRVRGG